MQKSSEHLLGSPSEEIINQVNEGCGKDHHQNYSDRFTNKLLTARPNNLIKLIFVSCKKAEALKPDFASCTSVASFFATVPHLPFSAALN
jgi:hypothetical protein